MTAIDATLDARASSARVHDAMLIITMRDGRELSVPTSWFPRLAAGSPKQQANCRIIESGRAINWPDLDEDIGVEPLLRAS